MSLELNDCLIRIWWWRAFCVRNGRAACSDGLDIRALDDPWRALAVLSSPKNTVLDHTSDRHRAAANEIGRLREGDLATRRPAVLSSLVLLNG